MRFDQLRYLDAAIRLGSMRRAADYMDITQPSLTQQIRRLEEELNVVLLIRRSTGVLPTDAASTLLPHLRVALQAENALHQQASAISGLHTGHIRLATVPTASRMFVPQSVHQFRRRYPNIRFEVIEGGSGQIRESVLGGESDVGVIARWVDEAPDAGLFTVDLLRGACHLCVPVNHRLASNTSVDVAELAGEDFVVVEPGQVLREVFEQIASRVDLRVVYQTTNSDSARRTVEAGVGISLQSGFGLANESSRSVTIPFAPPVGDLSISMIRRSEEQPAPATAAFMRTVREQAEQSC